MNWNRRDRLWLLALGTWCVAGFLATPGRAQSAPESAPATISTPPIAEEAKVHGTITVDFDKVTISELLKLVGVVEKMDGAIHIVSSKPRDDGQTIVVSAQRGVVSLSRPSAPQTETVAIGPADRVSTAAPAQPMVLQPPPMPGPSGRAYSSPHSHTEFPRLAALGRLLGLERRKPSRTAVSTPPRAPALHDPATIRTHGEAAPAVGPTAALPTSTVPDFILQTGAYIGALAEGEVLATGPFHSPWPAQPGKPQPAPTHDSDVQRADLGEPLAENNPISKHVAVTGDTFESLARQYYGDARYSRALWWANRDRVTWPDALAPGKSLAIPGLGQLEPKMVMAVGRPGIADLPNLEPIGPRRDPQAMRTSFTEAPPSPAAVSTEGAGGFALHVVRPEDTLRAIAREKCGDERKALEIITLNRDALSREGRPRVGQCLILPAPAAGSPAAAD